MRVKSVLGLIGVLVPVLYCGGLLYYFLDVSGSVENAEDIGLGPTILGLAGIGLLFCIPLVVKSVRMFAGPRSPGASGKGGGRGGPDASTHDDEGGGESGPDGGINADAVVARYMARRSAEAAAGSPATASTHEGGPVRPSGFGRRIR